MPPYRRAFVIYNPAAGSRRARRARDVEEALQHLRQQAETIEAAPTTAPGSATELARRACDAGADLVLACGGDGTINEVVNGLAGTSVALAALPAGTANVLAHEMGLPLDPVAAAGQLETLEPRRIGLGRVSWAGRSPRYFVSICGAGFDAHIVYQLLRSGGTRLGMTGYWLAGLRQLGRRPACFRTDVDGRTRECTFVLASRTSRYGGGLRLARRAHLLDTHWETVMFHSRSPWRYPVYLASAVAGTLARLPDVTFAAGSRLELESNQAAPVRIEVDGEYAGRLPAVVELAPAALTLLMPRDYIHRRAGYG